MYAPPQRHPQPSSGSPDHSHPMLLSPRSNASSTATTANAQLWNRYMGGQGTVAVPKKPIHQKAQSSDVGDYQSSAGGYGTTLAKKRLLTLAYDDREAVFSLPNTFAEVEEIARNWLQPPEGVTVSLRIPAEYASVQASRLVHGPYLWILNEETFQIAIDKMSVVRIEIVSDAPPPPSTEESLPHQDPIYEMPCDFDLELSPGNRVALGTLCSSEDLDMSRTEDGTLVDGSFWGVLKIVHTLNEHSIEFSGSRVHADSPQSSHTSPSPLALPFPGTIMPVRPPSTLKCTVRVNAPKDGATIEIGVCFSPMWSLTNAFPPVEEREEGAKAAKWRVKCRQGGLIEHISSSSVVSELFYEATPDTSQMSLSRFVSPTNSYALPTAILLQYLPKILGQLGLSIPARSHFMSTHVPALAAHRIIAYRFMSPKHINRAIELFCTHSGSPIDWTRVFFMWRGLEEGETDGWRMGLEAMEFDWRSVVEVREGGMDDGAFSILEVSAIECT